MTEPWSHHRPEPFRNHAWPQPAIIPRRGIVQRVVDGDTVDILVEVDPHILKTERYRVRGINAPESYGKNASPEGQAAKEFATTLLEGRQVLVQFHWRERTLDRAVADIIFVHNGVERSFADVMVEEYHAVRV